MIYRFTYNIFFGYNIGDDTLVSWAIADVYTSEESPRSKG